MFQIRNEEKTDYKTVEEITRKAFYNLYVPGCVEHYLVHIMREHEDFLPELRETAASLSMIAGSEIDRAALETAFLEELEALRRELPQETAERRSTAPPV